MSRTVIDGHGIDHDKTVAGKGACQPGYTGKPFTCLCGEGRFTLPELYGHMRGAEDSLALEASYLLGVIERSHTMPKERVKEAKARLDEIAEQQPRPRLRVVA